ncbi:MAG: universal stress protein [Daejeonella sp.]|uniref:universal stress protein n=1 Tax=Daejeonella sp. TaxID=2805397 RepID=UPI003C729610
MEKAIKNILVPLNFSTSSDQAIQLAIAMCKRHDATLHILQVNKENDFAYPTGKNALLIGIRLESRVAELKSLEKYANQIEEANQIKCFYHVEDGVFSTTVAEIADNFYCDIIVVQKSGASSPFNISFNRDVCKLINASSCPVMAVPRNCKYTHFKSVLFPVWVKRPIITKLRAALPIIEKNGSSVTLFGSVRSANDKDELDLLGKLMSSVRELISISTKNIKNEIEDAPGSAKNVLRKAKASNADLIIISAHTNTGYTTFFRQSYNRFIINRSTIPVLSVK